MNYFYRPFQNFRPNNTTFFEKSEHTDTVTLTLIRLVLKDFQSAVDFLHDFSPVALCFIPSSLTK